MAAKRLLKGIRNLTQRNIVAPIALFALSVFFLQLPLLNYLGYEFAAAVSFVVPWIVGFRAFGLFKRQAAHHSVTSWMEFRTLISSAIGDGMKLLFIPLITASLNMFIVRNCSYVDGIYFFFFIPVITALWSIGLMTFCIVTFRRARLMYTLFILVVLLYPVYVGYAQPQIYSYNFVYGYFPGFSYDEALSISATLVLFRVVTLVAALLLFCLAAFVVHQQLVGKSLLEKIASFREVVKPTVLNAFIVVSGFILILAWLYRVQLGFESSTAKLKEVLSTNLTTDHFEIHYAPGSFSDDEIKWVAAAHEFRFAQVSKALQVSFHQRITSFIYPTDDVKRELLGTSTTNIAKPWLQEIHLSKNSWQATLKHELTHVIAGDFGMPVIRAHYNIGLVEGLAVAVENDFGNRTLHEYAAAILRFGIVRNAESLVKPIGFWTNFSSVSYVMMGSFCKYLIDRFGIVRFKELYHGRPVRMVYAKSYDELIHEWQHFLDRIEVPDSWSAHVKFYFNRPSIFAKECARAIANINDEGYKDLEDDKSVAAMGEFSKALSTSWNSESYAGLIRAAYDAAKYDTVVELVDTRSPYSATGKSSLVSLFLLYGDALWKEGNIAAAREAYSELFSLDLSDGFNAATALRLIAIGDSVPQSALMSYFMSSMSDSVAARWLDSVAQKIDHPVLRYLQAKNALRLRQFDTAIKLLETLPSRGLGYSILNATREQTIAQSYFFERQFQPSRAHFWQSLNFTTNNASIQKIDDWLDRCEWYEEYGEKYLK